VAAVDEQHCQLVGQMQEKACLEASPHSLEETAFVSCDPEGFRLSAEILPNKRLDKVASRNCATYLGRPLTTRSASRGLL